MSLLHQSAGEPHTSCKELRAYSYRLVKRRRGVLCNNASSLNNHDRVYNLMPYACIMNTVHYIDIAFIESVRSVSDTRNVNAVKKPGNSWQPRL